MIKVEVIEKFTLKRFNELANLERAKQDVPGKLNAGDKFECSKELADYLLGNNPIKKTVVKVIEVEPKKDNNTIELEVSFDSKKAIDKVKEIEQNGGTYEEAVKEVEKIIDDTLKVKPTKKKKSKKSKK